MPSYIDRLARRVVNLETKVNRGLTSPQLSYSSIEDGAIEEYDDEGRLVSRIGKQWDGTHGIGIMNGPVPPRPSRAVVSGTGGAGGLLNFGWDGLFAGDDGETDITIPAPMDFSRIEAHASQVSGYTAEATDTLLDTIESPRGGFRTAMRAPGVWYVVLVTRSQSGKASPQSEEIAVTVDPVVGSDIDVDELREEFEEANRQLRLDLGDNILEVAAAQGRIDGLRDRLVPVESGLDAATASVGELQNAFPAIEQGMATLQNTTLPELQSAISGKNKIVNSTANASGTTGYVSGDTWQKWSSLATGGKLLAAWRFTTKWDPVIMDPTYLPQVDIGTGTFGELDGARLKVGTVSTRNLLVGSFENHLENPSFELDFLSWETFTFNRSYWSIAATGGRKLPKALRFTGTTTREFGPTSTNVDITSAAKTPTGAGNAGAQFRIGGWARTTSTGAARGELCIYSYSATGTFLGNRNFMIDTATSEWKYFSTILEVPHADTAYVRVRLNCTLPNVADEYFFDDISLVPAVDGSVIVNGSVTANEVNAASVGAAVGQFVEADIGKLTVSGTTNLRTVVAQRIAANVGSYIKLYANQVFVGHPGNMMPDPGFNDAGLTALRNANSTVAVDVSADNDLRLNNTGTGLLYLRPYGTPQSQAGVLDGGWIAVEPGQVWTLKFKVATWKGTTGWAGFVGRTADGSAYANPTARTTINSASQDVEVTATIPANCYWIIPEIAVAPGGFSYIKRNTFSLAQKITPSLIVDGFFQGLRVIGASIETNAQAAQGIKMNDAGLFAYSSTGQETLRLDGQNNILTGATIRTAATGARVQMSTTGLEAWGADNLQYLKADANGIELTGSIASKGVTAEAPGRPIAVRLTTVTRDVLGAQSVPNPALVFDDYSGTLQSKPGIYSPDGKTLFLRSQAGLLDYGEFLLSSPETILRTRKVTLGEHSVINQTTDIALNSTRVDIAANTSVTVGRYPETLININGVTKVNGSPVLTEVSAPTRARLTLTNGYTHWTSSGWNGLWIEQLGRMVIITGAVGNSSAWSAGSLIANVPLAQRPPNKVQGVNCELQADGKLQMGAPGSAAQSMSLTYFLN